MLSPMSDHHLFLWLLAALALAVGCPSDIDTGPDADGDADADQDTDLDWDRDRDGASDADSTPDLDGDIDADGDLDAESDADRDVEADDEPDADGDLDADRDSDADRDLDADAEPPDPCGDRSVIPALRHAGHNPLLTPRPRTAAQGSDNIYAPDVIRLSANLCLMWYGGQGGDGHDQIFLATSTDCHHWHHYPDDSAPEPILGHGGANHVNDPSVVRAGGTYHMYYTEAATGTDDRIHLATSPDGVHWTRVGRVLDVGPAGSWDSFKVGRPAVLYRDETFWLWYDGNDGTHRHVGLATSADGVRFERHPDNPLFLHAGAVDVELVLGTFVMLREAGDGTYAATSADGIEWCDAGRIIGLSGADFDRHGQVTPFVASWSGGFDALLYGGASHSCWCHNRIAQLYPEGMAGPADPNAGCEGCTSRNCTEDCRAAGFGAEGYCAHPGSADPGVCCACVPLP